MLIHRRAIVAGILCFQAGIAAAQTATSKQAAAGVSSSLLRISTSSKTKGASGLVVGPRPHGAPTVSLLGSVATASPAQSFALQGNLAYVCDNDEVSVIDVTNPQSPQVVATAASGLFQNSAITSCGILRGQLSVFSDQASTSEGDSPGYTAFDLTNPLQPALIAATPINKRFFGSVVYIGNRAFVATEANHFTTGFWDASYGDLLAVDLTNFSSPNLLGTLERPQVDPVYGGPTPVNGAVQADTALIYLGGATSSGGANNGIGRLQVVDVSNPASMQVVTQVAIPGALLFYAPIIQ